MIQTALQQTAARPAKLATIALLSVLAAACGGGGGSPGVSGSQAGSGGSTGSGVVDSPVVVATLVDGTGKATSTLSGGEVGTIRTTVTTSRGAAVPNAIVTFKASNEALVVFSPASASALTDDKGVAVMNIKPASFTSAGALTVTAEASAGGKAGTTTFNMAVGAAPLTVGTLSFSNAPSGSLPAFSTVTLNIPVTSNGQPVTSVTGLVLTSLCVGDGRAAITAGSVSNGVQVATYTNNGCLRGNDTITASIGNSSQTINLAVDSANIGAIQFVGSDTTGTSLVLKGSGGLGRKEAAVVTFRVVDQNNAGLSGVDVRFRATTTTGGLTVQPASGTTDANGNVTTTVSAGTIPTPVRVIAEATRNGRTISGLSDALTISTGLPIQKSMSMSADKLNIEGLEYDNEVANITVMMADQYGNPVSDNTTINFVTEGGSVGSSAQGACNTVNGACTVQLRSQNFRPANGRVTVLAYAQGIEDFIDTNGDGQYSCTTYRDANGNVPVVYRPLVDTCVSGGESQPTGGDMGDAFLDTGNHAVIPGVPTPSHTLDDIYESSKGDLPFPYGRTTYQSTGDGKWGVNYIRRSLEMIFSGSSVRMYRQVCTDAGVCRDWTAADGNERVIAGVAGAGCSSKALIFRLTDVNNNPLPFQTAVATADADKLVPGTMFPDKVPSTNALGGTFHTVIIKPEASCAHGSFILKVTTPKGLTTAYGFSSQ